MLVFHGVNAGLNPAGDANKRKELAKKAHCRGAFAEQLTRGRRLCIAFESPRTPIEFNDIRSNLCEPKASPCVLRPNDLGSHIRKFVHRVTGRKIEVAPKPRYRHALVRNATTRRFGVPHNWRLGNTGAFSEIYPVLMFRSRPMRAFDGNITSPGCSERSQSTTDRLSSRVRIAPVPGQWNRETGSVAFRARPSRSAEHLRRLYLG